MYNMHMPIDFNRISGYESSGEYNIHTCVVGPIPRLSPEMALVPLKLREIFLLALIGVKLRGGTQNIAHQLSVRTQ